MTARACVCYSYMRKNATCPIINVHKHTHTHTHTLSPPLPFSSISFRSSIDTCLMHTTLTGTFRQAVVNTHRIVIFFSTRKQHYCHFPTTAGSVPRSLCYFPTCCYNYHCPVLSCVMFVTIPTMYRQTCRQLLRAMISSMYKKNNV